MRLLFIRDFLTEQAASAICWTLIHSLWQALLFMMMAAVVMKFTVKSRPAVRYNILSIQFLLFIIVSVVTFFREWNMFSPGYAPASVETPPALPSSAVIHPVIFTHTGGRVHWLNMVADFLSAHASLIATIWLMVLGLKIVKITTALIYTQHVRNHKVHQPAARWADLIALRCGQLRITKTVRLLESEMMKVPAVFGHLKPVIFVPLGILANLPPQQVEAILIHELAHIQRGDYLMNLLQHVAESVFFFNPALRWISSLIREERENCCDDMAIGLTKDKTQFVESLISFRALSLFNHSTYLTAFPGSRNQVLNRVTRIVHNKNKTLNPMENIFLAASLTIFGFLTLAFSKNNETHPAKSAQPAAITTAMPVPEAVKATATVKPVAAARVIARDTLPEEKKVSPANGHSAMDDVKIVSNMSEDISSQNGKETTIAQVGDDVYKITKLNGSIVSLQVNGTAVAPVKIADYKGALNKINGQLDKLRAEQAIRDKEQEKRNAEQAVRNQEQAERNAEQAVRNQEQDERNAEQAKRSVEQAKRNEEQQERNTEQAKRSAEQAVRNAEQLERNQEQAARNAEQAVRNKEQEQRNAERRDLMNDLVSANIIKDSNSLKSLSLNNAEMIVNGQKQSSAVHERFKNKYLKSATDEINFRNF